MYNGYSRTFPICRVCKRRSNIVFRKFGKIANDLLLAHASREHSQNIADGDPHTPNSRLAAPLPRLDGDYAFVVLFHTPTIPQRHARQNSCSVRQSISYLISPVPSVRLSDER